MPEPTIEELEDWHARRLGFTYGTTELRTYDHWYMIDDDGRYSPHLDGDGYDIHPIDRTIDAAVLTFPKGWTWTRSDTSLDARHPLHHVSEPLTGHTPEAIRRDLLALARLAWISEGAKP